MNGSETGTASARRAVVVRGARSLREVRAYLPRNYSASLEGEQYVIVGEDVAGWTLDGYVIPRLASGLIVAEEVGAE